MSLILFILRDTLSSHHERSRDTCMMHLRTGGTRPTHARRHSGEEGRARRMHHDHVAHRPRRCVCVCRCSVRGNLRRPHIPSWASGWAGVVKNDGILGGIQVGSDFYSAQSARGAFGSRIPSVIRSQQGSRPHKLCFETGKIGAAIHPREKCLNSC